MRLAIVIIVVLASHGVLWRGDTPYITRIDSLYHDSSHRGYTYTLPLAIDDTTIAWGDVCYDWRLNLNTLEWSQVAGGGLKDSLRSSTPVIMPDGLWYFLSEEKYLKSYNPATGEVRIVDEFYRYIDDSRFVTRHPSGLLMFWGQRGALHFWWPEQHLHWLQYMPTLGLPDRNFVILEDGSIMHAFGFISTATLLRSTNLGRTWDTTFTHSNLDDPPTPRLFSHNQYVLFSRFDTLFFVNWQTGVSRMLVNRVASGDDYSVDTPDILYRLGTCFIQEVTLDALTIPYLLHSSPICDAPEFGHPPFLVDVRPYKCIQLPDGRMFTESRYGNPIFGLSSMTVRPFRIVNTLYSCDTVVLDLRGTSRDLVTVTSSSGSGMTLAGSERMDPITRLTLVRAPGHDGPFELYLTDGSFSDTLICPNLQRVEAGMVKLKLVHQAKEPTVSIVVGDTTSPSVLMAKWYRNGERIDQVLTVSPYALTLENPTPGDYHAVIMTEGYCTTVTDTVRITASSVFAGHDDGSRDNDSMTSVVVFDITGRILHSYTGIGAQAALEDIVRRFNRVFVRTMNAETSQLSVSYVVDGYLYKMSTQSRFHGKPVKGR